jgi:hypothetical protein
VLLRLEADGYEPEVVKAVLIAGKVTDIGSFRLSPVRGAIRIAIKLFERITNLEPDIVLCVAGGK